MMLPAVRLAGLAVLLACSIQAPARAQPGTAAAAATDRAPQPAPMTAVDMVEIATLSQPSLSPDGNVLAYLKDDLDWRRNRVVDRLVLREAASGEPIEPFAPERWREDIDAIAWSPDSRSFLTLLEREGDEHDQVYRFDLASRQLTRLTRHPVDIDNVTWAPDGAGFYFESDEAADDDDWSLDPYEHRPFEELFYYDIARDAYHRVVSADTVILDYSVARDGAFLLVTMRKALPKNEKETNEVWLVSREGPIRQLTDNAFQERDAQLSPDNSRFAFIAEVDAGGRLYHEDNLFVQDVGSDTPRLLFPDMAVEVLQFAWDASGEGLFFLGNVGLTTQLFHCDLATGAVRQVTRGEHQLKSWRYDHRSGRHVALRADARSPGDVVSIDPDSGAIAVLSPEFADFSARFALPRQEAFRWTAPDGREIEGLLVRPLGHRAGEPFPLVTISHGGPRSSVNFGSWQVSRYLPVLAGEGYGVFLPNYRGGTGYGDAFMRDMVGNYFNNSDDDILAGIDALVEAGLADPEALIAMGWSAGGHMTNWLIGQTDRFVAASSGAGASDWVSMYGESDFRRNRTFHFGGPPWAEDAPFEVFRRTSPVTHAWRVKTPTLFFSGENDERVPPTQGLIMYRALSDLGVETKLYLAKGEPHNFRRPRNQLFKINRELQWYARHRGVDYVPVRPELAAGPVPEDTDAGDGIEGEPAG